MTRSGNRPDHAGVLRSRPAVLFLLLLQAAPLCTALAEGPSTPEALRAVMLQALAMTLLKWTALVTGGGLLSFLALRCLLRLGRRNARVGPARLDAAPPATPK